MASGFASRRRLPAGSGHLARREGWPAAGLLLVVLVAGCGSTPWQQSGWQDRPHDPGPQIVENRDQGDLCRPPGRPAGDGWLRLALPGDLDPVRAPWPASDAETHVFANLYETLVRVGCDGEARPGLAATWSAYDGGRIWELRLRPDAVFWDGTPVTAGRILRSWEWAAREASRRGVPSPLRLVDPAGAGAVAAAPDRLVLRLREPSDKLPLELAHPALAVAAPGGPDGWPLGSGPCRPGPAGAARVAVTLLPHAAHPERPTWNRVEIVTGDTGDPGALLAAGCHALLIRSRAALDQVRGRPQLVDDALPFDRVYVLVTPPADDERTEAERGRWTDYWSARELARDVAAADAWPDDDIFLVEPASRLCAGLPVDVPALRWPTFGWQAATAARDRDLVLFPADDPDAGRLADRLAELAAVPRGASPPGPARGPLTREFRPEGGFAPQAVAVPPDEFPGALQSGRAGSYVLPLRRQAVTACGEIAGLIGRAEWLQAAAYDAGTSDEIVPPGATAPRPAAVSDVPEAQRLALRLARQRVALPLLMTRAHLVRVRGVVGIAVRFDGALDLRGAGWRAGYGP